MKEIRKKRGWTLKELAQKIGANWVTIWNYENARRKPEYDILAAMVTKAGVDPAELF
jgi:transcriptional regulator with XRE-family HTH domain